MKDRIKKLMESQHLTQQSFADILQISPASLSSIFNDRTKPTLNHVEAIHNKFPNINLSWLLYGTGEMFMSASDNEAVGEHERGTQSEGGMMLDFGDFSGTTTPSLSHQDQHQHGSPMGNGRGYYPEKVEVKTIDKPQRQISEIRIYFDDQTWEAFVPKK